jgi:hypothetical protein
LRLGAESSFGRADFAPNSEQAFLWLNGRKIEGFREGTYPSLLRQINIPLTIFIEAASQANSLARSGTSLEIDETAKVGRGKGKGHRSWFSEFQAQVTITLAK